MTHTSAPVSPEATPSGVRALPRNVWAATATSFLNDVSSEMIQHLLPLFLANVLGVHTGLIGLIEGLAESASSLLKIISGRLSDRLGRRKPLTVLGYGISTLAKPILYVAGSWWVVLGVRFFDRVGKGVRTAPRDALVADSVPENRRGLAFGLQRAGDTAGAFIGLLVALGVVWLAQGGAASLAADTFRLIVLMGVIPAIGAVLVAALGLRDVPVARVALGRVRLSFGALDAGFRRFLAVVVFFTLGNSADAFLILRAQERGASVAGILAMLVTFNLVYTVISGPAGALSDRIGRRRLLVAGWLVYAALYLGFGLAQTTLQIWILYTLYGVYYGCVEGVAKAFVADLVAPEQRGTAYGFYNAAVGFTALPASLIAGILWQGVGGWQGLGPRAPFLFGAALALLAVILLSVWVGSSAPQVRESDLQT